jgi:hypothetical protein
MTEDAPEGVKRISTKQPTTRTYPRIKDLSKTLPQVDPSKVTEALRAEPVGSTLGVGGSPLSLFQVRQELMRRLHSNGGRPSLSGTSDRKKIPLSHSQWHELEEIASEVASPGFSPSAGQIASVLVALSLRSVCKDKGHDRDPQNAIESESKECSSVAG